MPNSQNNQILHLNKVKDYELLNYWAVTSLVYRVAVREQRHLEPLKNHLAQTLASEGFRVKSAEWKEKPIPFGLIILTYEGTMIESNFLGEINRYDIFVMAQVLEIALMQYYQLQE